MSQCGIRVACKREINFALLLIRTREILRDQPVVIDSDRLARECEKSRRGGVTVGIARGVGLDELREVAIAHQLAHLIEEERASEIDRIGVEAEGAVVVDTAVHIAGGFEIVDAELPPPTDIGRIVVLVKDALAVGRQGFIQPRLVGMVTAHEAEPPLMRDLMHTDGRQVAAGGAVVLAVEISGKKDQSIVFHAVVHVRLHDGESLMRVRRELGGIGGDRFAGIDEHVIARGFVPVEIIRADIDIAQRGFCDHEFVAGRYRQRPRAVHAVARPLAVGFGRCAHSEGHAGVGLDVQLDIRCVVDQMLAPRHRIVQSPPAAVGDDERIPVHEVDLVEVVAEDIVRAFGWDVEFEAQRERSGRTGCQRLFQIHSETLSAQVVGADRRAILCDGIELKGIGVQVRLNGEDHVSQRCSGVVVVADGLVGVDGAVGEIKRGVQNVIRAVRIRCRRRRGWG